MSIFRVEFKHLKETELESIASFLNDSFEIAVFPFHGLLLNMINTLPEPENHVKIVDTGITDKLYGLYQGIHYWHLEAHLLFYNYLTKEKFKLFFYKYIPHYFSNNSNNVVLSEMMCNYDNLKRISIKSPKETKNIWIRSVLEETGRYSALFFYQYARDLRQFVYLYTDMLSYLIAMRFEDNKRMHKFSKKLKENKIVHAHGFLQEIGEVLFN